MVKEKRKRKGGNAFIRSEITSHHVQSKDPGQEIDQERERERRRSRDEHFKKNKTLKMRIIYKCVINICDRKRRERKGRRCEKREGAKLVGAWPRALGEGPPLPSPPVLQV